LKLSTVEEKFKPFLSPDIQNLTKRQKMLLG